MWSPSSKKTWHGWKKIMLKAAEPCQCEPGTVPRCLMVMMESTSEELIVSTNGGVYCKHLGTPWVEWHGRPFRDYSEEVTGTEYNKQLKLGSVEQGPFLGCSGHQSIVPWMGASWMEPWSAKGGSVQWLWKEHSWCPLSEDLLSQDARARNSHWLTQLRHCQSLAWQRD